MSQQSIFQQKTSENEESWISTSDMMSGLMIIFMFIAIAFINSLGTYIENTEEKICNELIQTFGLGEWDDEVTLKVVWPDGQSQTHVVDDVDQLIIFEEPPR